MMYFVLSSCWSVTTSSRSYFSWSGYSLPSPATNFSLPGSCKGDLTLGFLGGGDGFFLPWLILGSSFFFLTGEAGFRGDMDSFFFVFLVTISFHSPSGEWSVVVSTEEWVLGPSDDAMECWGVDGVDHHVEFILHHLSRGRRHFLFRHLVHHLDHSTSQLSADCFVVLLCWLVCRDVWVWGSCQVISNLTICFPSVKCQMGRPTIGKLLSAKAHTCDTSIVSIVLSSLVELKLHCLPLSMWIYINNLDQVI